MSKYAQQIISVEFGVTHNTIQDKCTRKMSINFERFYGYVKDYLFGKNDDLERVMYFNDIFNS